MKIETRKVGDVLIVEFSGKLDSYSSGDARDRMVNIVQGDDRRVLANLQNLEFLTSAGMRVFVQAAKLLQGKRGELKICSARPEIKEMLEVSGFNSLIAVYDTEEDACSSFAI
jgi:anti-sigma B factor antagonist